MNKNTVPPRNSSDSTTETYGFVVYVLVFPLTAAYLLWAYLPEETLRSHGVTYYPDQSLAPFVAAYLLQLVIAIVLLYAGVNLAISPDPEHRSVFADQRATVVFADDPASRRRVVEGSGEGSSVSDIYDIDVGLINSYLYRRRRT